jgi:hypothetical protein
MPSTRAFRIDAWITALLFAIGAGIAVFAGLMIVSWHSSQPVRSTACL